MAVLKRRYCSSSIDHGAELEREALALMAFGCPDKLRVTRYPKAPTPTGALQIRFAADSVNALNIKDLKMWLGGWVDLLAGLSSGVARGVFADAHFPLTLRPVQMHGAVRSRARGKVLADVLRHRLDLKRAKSGTFLKDILSQIAAIKSCQ